MKAPIVRTLALWQLIACALLALCADSSQGAVEEDEIPHDVLKGIEAMRRLPVDGFQLVQSQGRLLVVSTNGHFVIAGGRILDLWNNVEIRSVSDIDKSLRIPLDRMGIDAQALGGLRWGRAESGQKVTVFLDPASEDSRRLLPMMRKMASQYRIDVIFVPARNVRAPVSRALICDHGAAQAFLSDGRVPTGLADQNTCGVKELERARVTVQLLGIKELPLSVAPNGTTVAGSPTNYAELIAANRESK